MQLGWSCVKNVKLILERDGVEWLIKMFISNGDVDADRDDALYNQWVPWESYLCERPPGRHEV